MALRLVPFSTNNTTWRHMMPGLEHVSYIVTQFTCSSLHAYLIRAKLSWSFLSIKWWYNRRHIGIPARWRSASDEVLAIAPEIQKIALLTKHSYRSSDDNAWRLKWEGWYILLLLQYFTSAFIVPSPPSWYLTAPELAHTPTETRIHRSLSPDAPRWHACMDARIEASPLPFYALFCMVGTGI